MLHRYHAQLESGRALAGVDLSPRMVELAARRLGDAADTHVGDMRTLEPVPAGSAAALLSFFGLHHLDPEEIAPTLRRWRRALRPAGQLVVATWEGEGPIDYGGASDVVALRYRAGQLEAWASDAGFQVDRCRVEPIEGMEMDAVILEGTNPAE